MESGKLAVKGKRIAWIDWARAFAIVAVVICHATESVYTFSLDWFEDVGRASEAVAFSFLVIGRLGVPLFLFISGFLLLDREYDKDACKRFWKTKWLPLFLVTELWLVIYNVFLCFYLERPFDIFFLAKNLLFLRNVGMGHTWYLPMIIGLYLFVPYIANGLKKVDDGKLLVFPLCVAIVIFFGTPLASAVSNCMGFGKLSNMIEPGFSGGAYGCYMLLGYCFRKGVFKRFPAIAYVMFGIACFVFVVWLQIWSYDKDIQYSLWYNNALVLLVGISVFGLFSKGVNIGENPVIYTLSYYSFPIYLVHFPLRLALMPYFFKWGPIAVMPHAIQVLVFALVLIVLSLVICKIIASIPKIGPKMIYLR